MRPTASDVGKLSRILTTFELELRQTTPRCMATVQNGNLTYFLTTPLLLAMLKQFCFCFIAVVIL